MKPGFDGISILLLYTQEEIGVFESQLENKRNEI